MCICMYVHICMCVCIVTARMLYDTANMWIHICPSVCPASWLYSFRVYVLQALYATCMGVYENRGP